jgi:hypothetical protein
VSRRSRLEPIAQAVDQALADAGPAPAALTAVVRRWPRAVGELVAREAWPVRLQRDGALLVHCRSSVWASELRHLEPRLRGALEEHGVNPAPPLRFAVGVVPRRLPPAAPTPPDAPLDAAREELIARWSHGLRSERLRRAVARAARASLRARDSHPDDPPDPASGGANC